MNLKVGDAHVAEIDGDDFEMLSAFQWRLHTGGYAYTKAKVNGRWATVLMHRLVMKAPDGMEVDHQNENKLDNRKENLQLITPLEHRRKHAHLLVAVQKSRQKYPDTKNCVACNNLFTVNPRKRKRHKCCSPKCASWMRSEGRRRQVQLQHKKQHTEPQPEFAHGENQTGG